ncbi:hypothetical protein HUU61_00440 [Rhodopseudomonas palustris]|uniref:Uncharacterized protein n=1 Tax=Thiospirillum jenense TaxID=1653858 RepID=A0A839HCT7_9GAMM|nr:hypothetical protein [Thiospirillum jenense]MBB1089747.1 hypothetical protein [Rhodopseudomonas palustris]MBB1124849.1 hypothetical protein [Thiospirillum jenense]
MANDTASEQHTSLTATLNKLLKVARVAQHVAERLLIRVGQLLILSILAAAWLSYDLMQTWQLQLSTGLWLFVLLEILPLLLLGKIYLSLQTVIDLPAQILDIISGMKDKTAELSQHVRDRFVEQNTDNHNKKSAWSDLFSMSKTLVEIKFLGDDAAEIMPIVGEILFMTSPLFLIVFGLGATITILLFIVALIVGL